MVRNAPVTACDVSMYKDRMVQTLKPELKEPMSLLQLVCGKVNAGRILVMFCRQAHLGHIVSETETCSLFSTVASS